MLINIFSLDSRLEAHSESNAVNVLCTGAIA